MKLFNITLFLLLITACDSTSKNKEVIAKETINIGEGKNIKLSEVFESFEYVTLENKKIIGNIYKMKIENEAFYIHDNISKSIQKFNETGKFEYEIKRPGRGPGEYIMISDFLINKNTIEILNPGTNKRLFFDDKGNFVDKKKIETLDMNHIYLNESNIIGYNIPGGYVVDDYYYHLWNKDLTDVEAKNIPFYPYKDKYMNGNMYPFSKYHNTINFCADFSNIVYSINEESEITPKYILNFNYYKWPQEAIYNKFYNRTIFEWSKGMKPYVQFLRFIESDNYCYIGFYIEGNRKNSFYNKKDKSVVCIDNFDDDMGLGTTNFEIVGHSKGYWYAIVRISEMDNVEKIKEKDYSISDDTEFIILKLKLN